MTSSEPVEIGRRARTIRRRRDLSLDVAAGLAGISKSYLSLLETGQRRFQRRGLLEDLAGALGCSVADLTGQPYLPTDRTSADALAAVPGIRSALHEHGPDDVPDVPSRPLDELTQWASDALEQCAQAQLLGRGPRNRHLADLIARTRSHRHGIGLGSGVHGCGHRVLLGRRRREPDRQYRPGGGRRPARRRSRPPSRQP